MLLLRSWKESLAIFKPINFRLFLLVTIKSTLETYAYFIYYFWWLLLLGFVLDMDCYYPECAIRGTLWNLTEIATRFLLSFILCTLVRPSIEKKDYAYIHKQLKKFGLGFLLIGLCFLIAKPLIGWWLFQLTSKLFTHDYLLEIFYSFITFIYFDAFLIICPIPLFALLFYLDSYGTCKEIFYAIWRSIKMFIYNMPFCILSFAGIFCIEQLLVRIFNIYGAYIFFALTPFMASYLKNMYVKRLHDTFNIYFTT